MRRGLVAAGWDVTSCAMFLDSMFPADRAGAADLALTDPEVAAAVEADILFADLTVHEAMAGSAATLRRLATLLENTAPDLILLEHPWAWLPLAKVIGASNVPILYDSHNIEWRIRQEMAQGALRAPDAGQRIAAVRALEAELCSRAALVFAISDLEIPELAAAGAGRVIHLPPCSDLADGALPPDGGAFAAKAAAAEVAYCALIGSAYWPNVSGFFDIFPTGIGFLTLRQQIWVAGALGPALQADPRWRPFAATNAARFQAIGVISAEDKARLFAGARAAIVPVTQGAGAKLKTADALASARPVIATSCALEGYGPLLGDATDNGVWAADTPAVFRALVRRGVNGDLPSPPPCLRQALSPERFTRTLAEALGSYAPG